MGWACGRFRGAEKCMQNFYMETRREEQHGRRRCICQDNTKMDLEGGW